MTNTEYYSVFEQMIEDLQTDHREGISKVISSILNLSMRLEQEKALQAQPYERNDTRSGHRNGYKDKTLKTRMGDIPIKSPQVICSFEVSQAQVSDASKLLDTEIKLWRERDLERFHYLILDATYEKCRMSQSVVSAAVLIAYGVDDCGMRRVLGISKELSEAEVHWRGFLTGLTDRGLHGVKMITSDAHAGLKAAREAVFPTVPWQRCQFHLQQNASHHVPKKNMTADVAEDIRIIFNAPNREEANRFLKMTVKKYEQSAPS
jgi:transposase-like protein